MRGGTRSAGRATAPAVTALVAIALAIALALGGARPEAGAAARGIPIGDGRGGVARQSIGTFDAPIYVASAPGVRNRIYVVEREGSVQAVSTSGGGTPEFLNMRDSTCPGSGCTSEEGLLSIAFHPRYQSNGLLYAYFTTNAGDIRVAEFSATSDIDANEGSQRTVITIAHVGQANHNGGTVAFGRDGKLYLATGDGGGAGDEDENAQDKGSLLGKLLRIDPRRSGGDPYSVPRGNPFVGRPGRNEIFARGFRNPFRFSFAGRRIAVGDVGQDDWEEVDFEGRKSLKGANFGWDRFEGFHRFDYPGDNEASTPSRRNHERPIHEYALHVGGTCAITGGLVVRDERLRSLYGRYLYGDYCSDELSSLVARRSGARRDRELGISVDGPVAFGRGPNGRIYVAALDADRVYRLVPD